MQCDLLLLNFSNYADFPIFPYAFAQVSALARRQGLRVARADFLHVPPERRRSELERLVAQHRPRVVGITIRQGDSLMLASYQDPRRRQFHPIEATRLAIRELRELTRAPIMLGGIGFSIHPSMLFDHLAPDYACIGCADEVLARFEDVARGQPQRNIANLMFREDEKLVVPERSFFAPFTDREWDDTLVDELFRFYGAPHLAADAAAVPVEVMRGCPFRCYFCVEPLVKGKQWRTRDLDVVRGELDFLVSRDLRYFWFIASELNIDGTDFILELAEMMIRLREDHRNERLIWSGYILPWKLQAEHFEVLRRSGYRLEWNDFQSFSDDNLKKTRVPYRMKDVRPFIEAASDPTFQAPASTPGGTNGPRLTLFLGNAFADPTTITETLRYVDDIELQRATIQDAMIIPAVRLFESNRSTTNATPAQLQVFPPPGGDPVPFLQPTYQYPPALIDALGSPSAYETFLGYIAETFLSRAHSLRKDWNLFLAGATSRKRFAAHLRSVALDELEVDVADPVGAAVRSLLDELRDPQRRERVLEQLFRPPPLDVGPYRQLARILLDALEAVHPRALPRVKKALGLRKNPESEYKLMAHLYRRYDSMSAIVDDVKSKLDVASGSIEVLLLEKYLFRNNVVIDPRYEPLLFGT